MIRNLIVLGNLLLFFSQTYSQVNGKIISPSFSQVSNLVSYVFDQSSSSIIIKNQSPFKLEIYNIYPSCCDVSGPNKNGISEELNNNFQPGESIKISADYKGIKYFRSIVYKATDFDKENKSNGCELMILLARLGKEVCQAINGTNSCFNDAASVLEQNNWCDNISYESTQSGVSSKSDGRSGNQNEFNSNTATSKNVENNQQINQSTTDFGNVLIETVGNIYSTIEANQQRKEEQWNSLTPQQQQALLESIRRGDSIKWATKAAYDKQELNSIAQHHFSIGIYAALESRDFIAELSEFNNQDGYGNTLPILLNIKNKSGYNLGLNFEWTVDTWGSGDKTRRGLFAIGVYYVTYSSPMEINQNYSQSITFEGNLAMLKFQSMRVAPTASFRLFRLGKPRDLSGVFLQFGLKADYMFKATANPVSIDNNATTLGYSSISTTYKISDHFKKLEWGMVYGIRVDLTRHFFINVQYDILGGLNDQILKSKYAGDSEYYTFQHRHKTTVGIGISF